MKELAEMKLRILLKEAKDRGNQIIVPMETWKLLQAKLGKYKLDLWVKEHKLKVSIR